MALFPKPDHPSALSSSYWNLVGDWMRVVGGEHLRKVENTPQWPRGVGDLAEVIYDEAVRQARSFARSGTNGGFSSAELDERSRQVAVYLLDTYKPRRQRRFSKSEAAKGGRKSKRPSPRLEKLRTILHLSITEQAEALECTPRQVSRLRARINAETFEDEMARMGLSETVEAPHEAYSAPRKATEFDHLFDVERSVDEVFGDMGLIRTRIGWWYPDPDVLADNFVLEGLV